MTWLDAARVFAACGVVLIHCSADSSGQIFFEWPLLHRIGPVLLRAIAELSGSELFFTFSLFLLAMRADKASYATTMGNQARRLLVPFAAWTLFYTGFGMLKASVFGYLPSRIAELGSLEAWANHIFLGTAQYHLHFLPTLFAIMISYPLMTAGRRYPLAGLAIIPLIFVLADVQTYIWVHCANPELRDVLLRVVKIICYSGYGLAAFALYGIWQRGLAAEDWRQLRRFAAALIFFALVAKMPYYSDLIQGGRWTVREPAANFAHFLLPIVIFAGFMTTHQFAWSPVFSRLSRYTFGVFLFHPVVIDFYDIAVHASGVRLEPVVEVASKWLVSVPASFAATYLLSRTTLLAWTVGLGRFPLRRPLAAAPTAAMG